MKMQRTDIVDGRIRVEQRKTGVKLKIAIRPELAEAMRAGSTNLRFLIGSAHGAPMRSEVLRNLMRRAAKGARLEPRCKAHGGDAPAR